MSEQGQRERWRIAVDDDGPVRQPSEREAERFRFRWVDVEPCADSENQSARSRVRNESEPKVHRIKISRVEMAELQEGCDVLQLRDASGNVLLFYRGESRKGRSTQ